MMRKMTTSSVVQIIDKRYEKPIQFSIEPWVRRRLDEKVKPALEYQDKDFIIAIDGGEGGGKSTLAMQLGKYVDPTLTVDRVVFTPEEFREAIYKAKKGQCIIYDEAFTGFSSRAGLSGVNRTLISLMMQMRQKNLFVIIVLPTIFLLDKYVSLFRTKVLFHVYENKGRRGYYRVYSKRKKTQLIMDKGSKTYTYRVRSKKKGRFYGVFALGDEKEEEKYRKKKMKALEDSEKNPMNSSSVKYREHRDLMIHLLKKELKLSYREMSNLLSQYDFDISYVQIRSICAKYGDNEAKQGIKEDKDTENDDNSSESDEETSNDEDIE